MNLDEKLCFRPLLNFEYVGLLCEFLYHSVQIIFAGPSNISTRLLGQTNNLVKMFHDIRTLSKTFSNSLDRIDQLCLTVIHIETSYTLYSNAPYGGHMVYFYQVDHLC